jgi:hypothetical protein
MAIDFILKGDLNVSRHEDPSASFIDSLLVRRKQFEAKISGNIVLPELRESPLLMTYNDAATLLRTSPGTIVQLARERKIRSEGCGAGRRAARRSVYDYAMAHLGAVKPTQSGSGPTEME